MVLFAAAFEHRAQAGSPRGCVVRAFREAFRLAGERHLARVACTIPSAGWRLRPVDALYALVDAVPPDYPGEIVVCERDPALADMARQIIAS